MRFIGTWLWIQSRALLSSSGERFMRVMMFVWMGPGSIRGDVHCPSPVWGRRARACPLIGSGGRHDSGDNRLASRVRTHEPFACLRRIDSTLPARTVALPPASGTTTPAEQLRRRRPVQVDVVVHECKFDRFVNFVRTKTTYSSSFLPMSPRISLKLFCQAGASLSSASSAALTGAFCSLVAGGEVEDAHIGVAAGSSPTL